MTREANRRRGRRPWRGPFLAGTGSFGRARALAAAGNGGGRAHSRFEHPPEGAPTRPVRGVFVAASGGHGFLRSASFDYEPRREDPWVAASLVREFGLETGVEIEGLAVDAGGSLPGPGLVTIRSLNGIHAGAWRERTPFKSLIAEDPTERIRLEHDPRDLSTRVLDLVTPIGKGQRCLVVAPPKAGKTVLLQRIARAITVNHPDIHLIVLLVDERPEEVTDMRRSVRAEVIASSSDELARNHVETAEIVLARARGLVEQGRDVVVLLDSITRLARAYNAEQRGSGRVLSGGVDARTLERPRRFFGSARKIVGRGSLTVIATALVDTGSRMDEVIFQEFKGTGNTEIVLDRNLFERRIFPALDLSKSGTRKEEKLYGPEEHSRIVLLRRALSRLRPAEAIGALVERLSRYETNAQFLEDLLPR